MNLVFKKHKQSINTDEKPKRENWFKRNCREIGQKIGRKIAFGVFTSSLMLGALNCNYSIKAAYIRDLENRDVNVRRQAAAKIVDATVEWYDVTPAIPALIKVLENENEDAEVRGNAATALGIAAARRYDVTKAIPALIKALEDKNANVRGNAAAALGDVIVAAKVAADEEGQAEVQYITQAIPALIKALEDKNAKVRSNAAASLGGAAAFGVQGITPAIPAFIKALEDEDADVRGNAALALWCLAKKWQDITPAIPALTKALEDKNALVRGKAALALTCYYLNKGNEEEVNKLLNHKNADVRKGAAEAQKEW